MRSGALVSDSVVSDIVRERIDCIRCSSGFILDGFPRTRAQADRFEQLLAEEKLELDAVVTYQLPPSQIIARLSGRRTCERCKAIFHVLTKPSEIEGRCDQCGGKLYQRDDDGLESSKCAWKPTSVAARRWFAFMTISACLFRSMPRDRPRKFIREPWPPSRGQEAEMLLNFPSKMLWQSRPSHNLSAELPF